MHLKWLQVRICQQYYSAGIFSFCPLFVILGCCFRIGLALFDVFQLTRWNKSTNSKFWYYDEAMYSENLVANCISQILVIIFLNIILLIGILKDDENLFPYPWIVIELIEIILQIVGILCTRSIYSLYTLVWKLNYWLATGCLLLGRTCVKEEF